MDLFQRVFSMFFAGGAGGGGSAGSLFGRMNSDPRFRAQRMNEFKRTLANQLKDLRSRYTSSLAAGRESIRRGVSIVTTPSSSSRGQPSVGRGMQGRKNKKEPRNPSEWPGSSTRSSISHERRTAGRESEGRKSGTGSGINQGKSNPTSRDRRVDHEDGDNIGEASGRIVG